MSREKITLGGYELWVEYDERLCCITIFDFETAKHGLNLDVMGMKGYKHVNGFIYTGPFGGSARLTKQEEKELNDYINQKDLSFST
jgi:hypothetical protein